MFTSSGFFFLLSVFVSMIVSVVTIFLIEIFCYRKQVFAMRYIMRYAENMYFKSEGNYICILYDDKYQLKRFLNRDDTNSEMFTNVRVKNDKLSEHERLVDVDFVRFTILLSFVLRKYSNDYKEKVNDVFNTQINFIANNEKEYHKPTTMI